MPPKPGAEVRNGRSGTLEARLCALSVQLSDGQVVQVDFVGKKKAAQLILSVSMLGLITGDS
ncbi:hypothetical protein [Amycolatopsis sp. NPDC102389]|uniref:hypothetical protein n=1 Tax=Amycolatopsis sp. NPDC102389 TaxID=3363941 RepID=UPI0037F51D6C